MNRLWPRVCAAAWLSTGVAFAGAPNDPNEFELPSFKAPVSAEVTPSPPPLPVPSAPAPAPPLPALEHVQWFRLNATVSGAGSFGASTFLGGHAFVGAAFGTPRLEPGTLATVSGWVVTPGLEFNAGALTTSLCGSATPCGYRVGAGPSVRLGWGSGVADRLTGQAHQELAYFGQLAVLGGAGWVPSAPLAPGVRWAELSLRVGVGLHWSTRGSTPSNAAPTSPRIPVIFTVVLYGEGLPLRGPSSGGAGGVTVGLSL